MKKEENTREIVMELYEQFYNQNTLIKVICNKLEEFEFRSFVPEPIKADIKDVCEIVWVAESISKQINNNMNKLLKNDL